MSSSSSIIVFPDDDEDHNDNNNNDNSSTTSSCSHQLITNHSFNSNNNSNNSSIISSSTYHHRTPTSADELIAEAFLRCARIRTCFTVWRSKSQERTECYQISQQVADTFRSKYLAWNTLRSWRDKAEEQNRLSEMSLVAWGWHARRAKRKVLQGWRRYCDDVAIKRVTIREELETIRFVADQQTRLQCLFTWMALASRGQVASTFYKFKKERNMMRVTFGKWQEKFFEKKVQHFRVEHLKSRVHLQQQFKLFNYWFLESFAQKKKAILDKQANLESQSVSIHRHQILSRTFSKWKLRKLNSTAHRFYAQKTLRKCFVKVWHNQQYLIKSSLRKMCKEYQRRRDQKQITQIFRKWQAQTTLQEAFVRVSKQRTIHQTASSFRKWKLRLEESRDEKQWMEIGSEVKTNLVLKKGFEALIQSASDICYHNNNNNNNNTSNHQKKNHQQQPSKSQKSFPFLDQTNKQQQNNYRNYNDDIIINNNHSKQSFVDPTTAMSKFSAQEEERLETSIRSTLSSFRNLMLTSQADRSIIADDAIAESSSVKKSAILREKERGRLRATIMQLRDNLANVKRMTTRISSSSV